MASSALSAALKALSKSSTLKDLEKLKPGESKSGTLKGDDGAPLGHFTAQKVEPDMHESDDEDGFMPAGDDEDEGEPLDLSDMGDDEAEEADGVPAEIEDLEHKLMMLKRLFPEAYAKVFG